MKNIKLRNQKGVTLTALVITVTAILILTSVVFYNATKNLKLNNLRAMKTDINNLRDKVSNYYAKYGDIPVIKSVLYTNIANLESSNLLGANDTGNFYIIDLKSLENLTLHYGKDYEKIQDNPNIDINLLNDIYIINEDSHNIFYIKGIELDGKLYYTDYNEKDVDSEKVNIINFEKGSSILPGKMAKENEIYLKNGEAIIPKGFMIVPGCDDISKGLVISDNINDTEIDKNNKVYSGNQFVWIPVIDMNKFVRQEGYINENLQSLLVNCGEADGNGINKFLQDKGLSESNTTKEEAIKMYKSVKENKGFYIGRYETSKNKNEEAEVKKDKIVWNNISWANSDVMNNDLGGAVEKARGMYTDKNTYGVTSTLCYGVQWDAGLNFIDSNYISNGINGKPNCQKDSYIVNSNGKGNVSDELINTGSNDKYSVKNIYDMAGNVYEWTMETYDTNYRVYRGNSYKNIENITSSSFRDKNVASSIFPEIGFRITLFID